MKLSSAPLKYEPGDQARMRQAIQDADAQNVKKQTAQPAIYLTATDTGATMKMTVNAAGVMTWTQVTR